MSWISHEQLSKSFELAGVEVAYITDEDYSNEESQPRVEQAFAELDKNLSYWVGQA